MSPGGDAGAPGAFAGTAEAGPVWVSVRRISSDAYAKTVNGHDGDCRCYHVDTRQKGRSG